MAINASDITLSLIPETVLGTTPATGNRYELPIKSGQALPTYSANEIKSETMRPNRAGNGQRRGNGSGEGSLEFHFQSTEAIDYLVSSALSGAWDTVVGVDDDPDVTSLKAGKTDKPFTVVAALKSDWFQMSAGAVCSGMTIAATAAETVNATFPFVFTARTDSQTNNPITVTASSGRLEYAGHEVTNITIDGVTVNYSELSFEVTQDRAMRNVLGSTTPIGVGTGGNRQVQLTLKFYKESRVMEQAFTGEKQSISFDIGVAGDGYRFTIPAGQASFPTDESGNELMISVVFAAAYDNDAQTDLIVTKL